MDSMISEAPLHRATSEPTLNEMMNQANGQRDTITDIEQVLTAIEDYMNGPRPEKPQEGNVEGCPAGIMASICQVNASNNERLAIVHRRVAAMAQSLGVNR